MDSTSLIDITKLKDAISQLFSKPQNKSKIIYGVVIVAFILILFIGFAAGKYYPDPNSKTVQTLLNQQLATAKEQYNQTIKDKDQQISDIQTKLTQSQTINLNYQKQITVLKGKMNNIVAPKTDSETRARLKEMGYETH